MISRTNLQNTIQRKLETNRVVGLIGPRQCGNSHRIGTAPASAQWRILVLSMKKSSKPPYRMKFIFWGAHSGAEPDLLLLKNGKRIGVECKRVDAPHLTPSMRTALTDLNLSKLLAIYPRPHTYLLLLQKLGDFENLRVF